MIVSLALGFTLELALFELATKTLLLVKLIFSFLLSYPLAGLLKRVPDGRPEFKNVFIIRYGPGATTRRISRT